MSIDSFLKDIYDIGKYATKLKNIKLELNQRNKKCK